MLKPAVTPLWIAVGAFVLAGFVPPTQAASIGAMTRKAEEVRRDAGERSSPQPSGGNRAPQGSPGASRGDDRGRQYGSGDRRNDQRNDQRADRRGGQRDDRGHQHQRNQDRRDDRRDDRRYSTRDDRRHTHVQRDNRRDHRHVTRVVQVLPGGYRDYYWNGSRYYYHGGAWYRPYGSSYVTVGVPYGLFVGTLPSSYTSVWVGGTRYFHADDTYYTYEAERRGYVVTRSPYDDEYHDEPAVADEDLYIYPAQGQSEQQQADDRYECHRWAAQESGYDPIDDGYEATLRAEYLRAMTACLTGRGYSVR